jgi:RNA-binding protein 8A
MRALMEVDVLIGEIDNTEIPTTRQGIPVKKSIEGYVLIGTNIHEEATEEDLDDFFSEFGSVKSMHLNLDRQTGYVKGYILVEYGDLEEAQRAIEEGNGQEVLGREIQLEFAFVEGELGEINDLQQDEKRKREIERDDEGGRYGSLG